MTDIEKNILKNAEGNIYFYLSGEAKAINNSSKNLKELINKTIPVANTLKRHINIYGFNPIEGVNFICRVNPNGEIGDKKITQSSVIETPLMELSCNFENETYCFASVVPEDISSILKNETVSEILGALVTNFKTAKKFPLIRPAHRKLKDKENSEQESLRQGFDADNDLYDSDGISIQDLFATTDDEDISITLL